jgi:hypothetical protein
MRNEQGWMLDRVAVNMTDLSLVHDAAAESLLVRLALEDLLLY